MILKVRFALCSSSTFSRTDSATDSETFYNSILDLLRDVQEKEEVQDLLNWWNRWAASILWFIYSCAVLTVFAHRKIFPHTFTDTKVPIEGSALCRIRERRNARNLLMLSYWIVDVSFFEAAYMPSIWNYICLILFIPGACHCSRFQFNNARWWYWPSAAITTRLHHDATTRSRSSSCSQDHINAYLQAAEYYNPFVGAAIARMWFLLPHEKCCIIAFIASDCDRTWYPQLACRFAFLWAQVYFSFPCCNADRDDIGCANFPFWRPCHVPINPTRPSLS